MPLSQYFIEIREEKTKAKIKGSKIEPFNKCITHPVKRILLEGETSLFMKSSVIIEGISVTGNPIEF